MIFATTRFSSSGSRPASATARSGRRRRRDRRNDCHSRSWARSRTARRLATSRKRRQTIERFRLVSSAANVGIPHEQQRDNGFASAGVGGCARGSRPPHLGRISARRHALFLPVLDPRHERRSQWLGADDQRVDRGWSDHRQPGGEDKAVHRARCSTRENETADRAAH